MDVEDQEPVKAIPKKKNLEVMSIEALREYIAGLETEIERAQGAISAKQNAREGAESFFKK